MANRDLTKPYLPVLRAEREITPNDRFLRESPNPKYCLLSIHFNLKKEPSFTPQKVFCINRIMHVSKLYIIDL